MFVYFQLRFCHASQMAHMILSIISIAYSLELNCYTHAQKNIWKNR